MTEGHRRLKQWRERSKLTQREMAEMLDIHEVYLSQILAGDRNPGLSTAHKIEDVTGISTRSWEQSSVSKSHEPVGATVASRRQAKR